MSAGFQAGARAAGAILPRFAPLLAPAGLGGPLLFAISAALAAMILWELLRQSQQRWGAGYRTTCNNGSVTHWSSTYNAMSPTPLCVSGNGNYLPGVTNPNAPVIYGWQYISGTGILFGRTNQHLTKNAGVTAIWPGIPRADLPRRPWDLAAWQADRALSVVVPDAMPFDIGVDDVPQRRVWMLPAIARAQRGSRTRTIQMTDRAYQVGLPVVRPAYGRTIAVQADGMVMSRPLVYPMAVARPIARYAAPPRGTTEIKTRAYPIVSAFLNRFVGIPSEINDLLDAMHSALPRSCQDPSAKRVRQNLAIRRDKAYNAKYKRARNSPVAMINAIAKCGEMMDLPNALKNMVHNEIVDHAYGGAGRSLGMLNRQARMPLGVQQLIGKAPQRDNFLGPQPKREVPYHTTPTDAARWLMRK